MSGSVWGESFGIGHLWECADQTWTWIVFEALQMNLKCLCPAYLRPCSTFRYSSLQGLFSSKHESQIWLDKLYQNDWMHQQSCACAAFISMRLWPSLYLVRRKRVEEFLLEAFRSRRIPSSDVVGLSSMNWCYTWLQVKKHELLSLQLTSTCTAISTVATVAVKGILNMWTCDGDLSVCQMFWSEGYPKFISKGRRQGASQALWGVWCCTGRRPESDQLFLFPQW